MTTPPFEETPKRKLHEGHIAAVLFAVIAGGYLLYNSVVASYEALVQLATRIGVAEPWRVALTGEISLLVIVVWDIVFTWCRWQAPILRWIARALTLLSVVINAAAGWPDFRAMLIFLPAPLVVLGIVESVRHVLLRKHATREPIPWARRVHHRKESRELRKFMVKWEIVSYRLALDMQQQIMAARKRLEVALGADWRVLADADLVWMLDDAAPATLDLALTRVAEIYDAFQRARAESAADAEADEIVAALTGADSASGADADSAPNADPAATADPAPGADPVEPPALTPPPPPPNSAPKRKAKPDPVPEPQNGDSAGKGGKKALGRALWNKRMSAGGPPPDTAELVAHTGAGDSTARAWRAEWTAELGDSAVAPDRAGADPDAEVSADADGSEVSVRADTPPAVPTQRQSAAAESNADSRSSADPAPLPSADSGAGSDHFSVDLGADSSADPSALDDMYANASAR
ncbi:hypothetical protein ACFOY2_45765 [Nonomuraea purpurea]|uniref:DUF2637 domain-containing protein n=1 Tax=Nonomuraea purpurea TaxID=1849276 RepID=A0ABV8GNS8_9ACTN